MMPNPKITIGAERSLNRERYCMTLIKVSASNADSYRTVCSRIACMAFSEAKSGKGYPKHNRAETNGFLRVFSEVEYDGFRANSGGDIICRLKHRGQSPRCDHLGRAKLADSARFQGVA